MARKSRKNLNTGLADVKTENRLAKAEDGKLLTGAYIRLSAENNNYDTNDSLLTQIDLVESYIKENPQLQLAETYIDNGFSGTNFERPEFIRMIEDVKCGRLQCIVVKDLSRFGRDYLETGYYLETIFPLLNVRFIAINDDFDSSREEDRNSLSIPIKNMVNAMYARDASRKCGVYHDMCLQTGKFHSMTPPYGYQLSEDRTRLVIDPETEPYVRLVFLWTLAGVCRSEIAKRMEILGAPTTSSINDPDSKPKWDAHTVKGILSNPVYAGYLVMGKLKQSLFKGIPRTFIKRDEWIRHT